MLFASLVLVSCSKQLTEPAASDKEVAAAAPTFHNNSGCKPVVFGAFSQTPSGASDWRTFAQKWYSGDDVAYLKFSSNLPGIFANVEHDLNMDWAEVTYEGNQVRLRDVVQDELILRVTLDNDGRPVASYYDNTFSSINYERDTTYFYYTNDRLDSAVVLRAIAINSPMAAHSAKKYIFEYDAHGNIREIDMPSSTAAGSGSVLSFVYNYGMPVTGIMVNYRATMAMKLLEHLELLKLPMNHAVSRIIFTVHSTTVFTVVHEDNYVNYVLDNGRVHSFQRLGSGVNHTYYNGWECSSAPTSRSAIQTPKQNGIMSLEEFNRAYPR